MDVRGGSPGEVSLAPARIADRWSSCPRSRSAQGSTGRLSLDRAARACCAAAGMIMCAASVRSGIRKAGQCCAAAGMDLGWSTEVFCCDLSVVCPDPQYCLVIVIVKYPAFHSARTARQVEFAAVCRQRSESQRRDQSDVSPVPGRTSVITQNVNATVSNQVGNKQLHFLHT